MSSVARLSRRVVVGLRGEGKVPLGPQDLLEPVREDVRDVGGHQAEAVQGQQNEAGPIDAPVAQELERRQQRVVDGGVAHRGEEQIVDHAAADEQLAGVELAGDRPADLLEVVRQRPRAVVGDVGVGVHREVLDAGPARQFGTMRDEVAERVVDRVAAIGRDGSQVVGQALDGWEASRHRSSLIAPPRQPGNLGPVARVTRADGLPIISYSFPVYLEQIRQAGQGRSTIRRQPVRDDPASHGSHLTPCQISLH
jgi:hypothetical protein